MNQQHDLKNPAEMEYEESRDELASIVAQLEEGTASLDESLTLWERGEALAKRCNQWLDTAQTRLDAVGQAVPAEESEERPGRVERESAAPEKTESRESTNPPW